MEDKSCHADGEVARSANSIGSFTNGSEFPGKPNRGMFGNSIGVMDA